jgi:hypothetical protein
VQKSVLLRPVQQEILRHDFSYFVGESPSMVHGGKGVVVPGCPACKKRINTMNQFLDHLAEDAMPALIEKAVRGQARITLGRTCLKRDSKQRTVQSYLAEKSYSKS